MMFSNKALMKSATLEPETLATIARMSSAPGDAYVMAYDNLIKSIKGGQSLALGTNNLITKFDCLYIRAAHHSQAALLNWAKNAHDATAVNSPTFTTNRGYKSNGTTSYLDLNYNPSTDASVGSSEFAAGGYVVEDVTRGNKAIFGSLSSGNVISARILPRTTSDVAQYTIGQSSGAGFVSISNTDMRGFYSVHRVSTTRNARKDTITDSNDTGVNAFENLNMYELAWNNNGTAALFLDATVSFTYFGRNTIDHANVRTAMRNYLLSLGVTGI